jgi:prophage endopeptidase
VNSGYGYALALLIGAGGAWYVQGLRWETDVQERDLATATEIGVKVEEVNQQLIASRAQTEQIRQVFIDYKAGKENETNALERAVADGTKRLRVKASCPAVRADGTVSGGAVTGTAELEPSARFDYFLLKKGLDRQYAELQFCRSELRKRSSK